MGEILYDLGAPKALYLAGEDGEEGGGEVGDPVVMRYEREFRLIDEHPCDMLVFLDPKNYVTENITIVFVALPERVLAPISRTEVERYYGKEYRVIHRSFVPDEDDLEGRLRNCDDPNGEVASLLYSAQGLEVGLDPKGEVRDLRFSLGIWSGEEQIHRCDESK